MPKQRPIDEPIDLSVEGIFKQIAVGVSDVAADREELSLAEQWKIDLLTGTKDRMELIQFLDQAPGKPSPGQHMDPDIPVPWYAPGEKQLAAHREDCRTKVVAGGWRAGKSKWLAAELLPYMFKDHARVWIVGPDYSLATEEFEYIRQWLQWMGCPMRVSDPQDGSKQLWTKWGAHLETKPAIREKLEAAALNAAGVAEAGAIPKDIVDQLRSRLMQRRGPLLLSGRMEADQLWYIQAVEQFKTPRDGWASFSIPSWENIGMFPGGRKDPEILQMERELPEDEFRRKVCAEVVKSREIVFHEFDVATHVVPIEEYEVGDAINGDTLVAAYSIQPPRSLAPPKAVVDPVSGRVQKWQIPSTAEVTVAIDPGWEHAYAVLALCRFDDLVFVIDELYLRGTVAEDVIYECKQRDWWPRVTAVAGGPTYSVIDVAANQHQGQKSHHEIWREHARLYLRTQKVPITDGILRLRTFLERPGSKEPRLYVSPNCTGLIDEFGKYRYRLQKENRPIKEEPIDRDNHSIKALTYWLIVNFDFVDRAQRVKTTQRYVDRRPQDPDRDGVWHTDFGWNGF